MVGPRASNLDGPTLDTLTLRTLLFNPHLFEALERFLHGSQPGLQLQILLTGLGQLRCGLGAEQVQLGL